MDLEQALQALRAADERAQAGDQQAADDARRLAQVVEQLRQSPTPSRDPNGFMGQVNAGIADTLGGLADFINPFDTPAVSQALGMGDRLSTGSARPALVRGMEAIGADVATEDPQGFVQGF